MDPLEAPLRPSSDHHEEVSNPLTTAEALEKLEQRRNLHFFRRMFSPMEIGSLRSVVIMWIRICSGIGLLTLPYYVMNFGLWEGAIVVMIAAYLNFLPATYLFNAVSVSKKTTYPSLVEHYFGRKIRKVFDFNYFLDLFSQIFLLQIASWNCLEYIFYMIGWAEKHPEWFNDFNKIQYNEYNLEIFLFRLIFVAITTAILIPFFLKDNLRDYKIITYSYLGLLFTLVIFLVAETPLFMRAYSEAERDIQYFKPFVMANISNFGGVMLCFYVQPYLFSLFEELVKPNNRRLSKIGFIATLIEGIMFLFIGICGYAGLGEKYTPNVFFLRRPYPGQNMTVEWVFRGVVISFFFVMIIGIPMYNPTLKAQIYEVFEWKDPNRRQKTLASLVPLFIASAITLFYPNVTSIFNILSVTICNVNGYLLPVLLEIKWRQHKKEQSYLVYGVAVFYGLFFVFGMISLFFS